ncbi:MAG: Ig-like domain-containing protein, partial [Clostridia bacterium]
MRKGVDWRSSNTRVATVTDGVVTGLAAGTSTITATAQDGTGRSARINISVGTAVRSIDLVSATGGTQVAAGRSLQLTANVQPTNASNRKVIWSSSDPALATVASTSGKVTARAGKTGTVIITATAADGSGVTNQLTLSLVPATASVVITPGPQYTVDLNNEKTVQFSSVCLPEQAMQNVVWRTNSSAFTIDQNGLATASRKGSYIVRERDNPIGYVEELVELTADVRSDETVDLSATN